MNRLDLRLYAICRIRPYESEHAQEPTVLLLAPPGLNPLRQAVRRLVSLQLPCRSQPRRPPRRRPLRSDGRPLRSRNDPASSHDDENAREPTYSFGPRLRRAAHSASTSTSSRWGDQLGGALTMVRLRRIRHNSPDSGNVVRWRSASASSWAKETWRLFTVSLPPVPFALDLTPGPSRDDEFHGC